MNKKLFAFDLDGTLMYKGKVSDETKDIIRQLDQAGHKVCILTGRAWKATQEIYESLRLDTLISNYNGSHLHNPTDNEFIDNVITLDITTTLGILSDDLLQKVGDNVAIKTGNTLVLKHKPNTVLSDFLHVDDYDKVVVGLSGDTIKKAPIGVLVSIKKEYTKDIDVIVKHINQRWGDIAEPHIWKSGEDGDIILDIMNKDSHKGTALVQMASYYDISMSDVIAFGDNTNDIPMLGVAGIGVAMSNGKKALKDVACMITDDSNAENGVVNFLNWFKTKDYVGVSSWCNNKKT